MQRSHPEQWTASPDITGDAEPNRTDYRAWGMLHTRTQRERGEPCFFTKGPGALKFPVGAEGFQLLGHRRKKTCSQAAVDDPVVV
jgi:hypothetical protein